MSYANVSEAIEYYAGDDAGNIELQVVMRRAAALVQQYAPVPDPEPSDYARMAADAELEVGRYLWDTDSGSVTSQSLPSGSTSFADTGYIKRTVRDLMGIYYTAGTSYPIVGPYRRGYPYFINDPLDLKGPYPPRY